MGGGIRVAARTFKAERQVTDPVAAKIQQYLIATFQFLAKGFPGIDGCIVPV